MCFIYITYEYYNNLKNYKQTIFKIIITCFNLMIIYIYEYILHLKC